MVFSMLNAVAKKITVLVNDALNTFYLQFYDVKTCLRSIQMRGNLLSELHIYIVYVCVCIYHPKDRMSHHCGALAEMRNSSMDPPGGIDLMLHHTLGGTLPHAVVLSLTFRLLNVFGRKMTLSEYMFTTTTQMFSLKFV